MAAKIVDAHLEGSNLSKCASVFILPIFINRA